jgi:hypothetical protein
MKAEHGASLKDLFKSMHSNSTTTSVRVKELVSLVAAKSKLFADARMTNFDQQLFRAYKQAVNTSI